MVLARKRNVQERLEVHPYFAVVAGGGTDTKQYAIYGNISVRFKG